MPILFSAVAYDNKFQVKYASCDGNFAEIADEVLLKVPAKNGKMTYSHGHYLLHYIAENQHFYFCITDKTCQRSRAFLYLNEIKRRFSSNQGPAFYEVLADEMYRYNEDYSTIVIRKGDLDELNNIGVGDSESLLGDKILFVNNPEELTYSVTVTRAKELPQSPTQEATAKETLEKYLKSEQATESKLWKIYSSAEHRKNSENESESPNFLYYAVVTVILVLMWLASSAIGSPIYLVAVAFICVVAITKFRKSKNL